MEHIVFYLGAEAYYFGGIGKAEMVKKLCIRDTDLFLLEMPFCQWTREMLDDIKGLIQAQKVTVILAHIERYFDTNKPDELLQFAIGNHALTHVSCSSFFRLTCCWPVGKRLLLATVSTSSIWQYSRARRVVTILARPPRETLASGL